MSFDEFYELMKLVSRFGIILVYIYMCDRTRIFQSQSMQYSWTRLHVPLILFAIMGLLSTRKSKNIDIMNVDITREWKGFIQIYILIFHYLDAYNIFYPYLWARISVSSYIFLSGFGHFCYFWRRPVSPIYFNDMNSFIQSFWPLIKRYLEVMFRLNFFLFCLHYVTNRNFDTAYFVPLVSHWFSVVYLLMCIWPRVSGYIAESANVDSVQHCTETHQPRPNRSVWCISPSRRVFLIMLLKIFILAILTHAISISRSAFRWIFQTPIANYLLRLDLVIPNMFMQALSGSYGSEDLWYFRWSLDRYSAIFGVSFGLMLKWLYTTGLMPDYDGPKSQNGTNHSNSLLNHLPTTIKSALINPRYKGYCSKVTKFSLTSLGLIGLAFTFFYAIYAKNIAYGIKIQCIFCIVPILSYIIVRNSSEFLRCRFSTLFAWIGDNALELYVGQRHLWLARSGTSNLVMIPGYPLLNVIVTFWTFGLLCDEIHQLTAQLQKHLVPKTPAGLLWAFLWVPTLLLFLNGSI